MSAITSLIQANLFVPDYETSTPTSFVLAQRDWGDVDHLINT